jgi:cation diffusion facilitator family transporter
MHIHNLHRWQHSHRFNIDDGHAERNTRRVILLTLSMMIIEIAAGYIFGSMALLADGWHMGTHAAALGITAFAYRYARKHAQNPNYSFGTGKVGVLGGFGSAVVLAVIALLMGVESVQRLFAPVNIRFNEAIAVAIIGLAVNLISAYLLRGRHHYDHGAGHGHHHDHNLRAAYLHVLADALTSVLAIFALLTGKAFGWIWMDPIMGIVGALIISRWSYGLLVDTSKVLLDRDVNAEASAIVSVVTHYPKPPDHYKQLLAGYDEMAHVTVEVNQCEGDPCLTKPEPVSG